MPDEQTADAGERGSRSVYGGVRKERTVDQIVINHGTIPLDDLYFGPKPLSQSLGAVDHGALIAGRAQAMDGNPGGAFQLFRIGDAVAARNTHADLRRRPADQGPMRMVRRAGSAP